jgi:hypothetical protein
MPPALSRARFGMSAARVSRIYKTAWTKKEEGTVMLAHYPRRDKSQVVRFHFAGDSLYLVQARLNPAEGQTAKQLYDDLRGQYEAYYANVAKRSATSWSDGTVTARIRMHMGTVEVSLNCPAARKG